MEVEAHVDSIRQRVNVNDDPLLDSSGIRSGHSGGHNERCHFKGSAR